MKYLFTFACFHLLFFSLLAQSENTLKAFQLDQEGKSDEAFLILSKMKSSPDFKYDTLGMKTLGLMYFLGRGTIKDVEEGVKWFDLASQSGCQTTRILLGICYTKGMGVKKDYKTALEYLQAAADAGNTAACDLVAEMYLTGDKDFPQNGKEAVKWLRISATNGSPTALRILGNFFENGLNGLSVDKKEAAKLYEKSALLKDEIGILQTGIGYLKGIGVKIDENKAFAWFNKIPDNKEAQFFIGRMYDEGWEGHPANPQESEKWFKKSAKQGNSFAQEMLDVINAPSKTQKAPNDTKNNYTGHTSAPSLAPKNDKMSIEEVVELLKNEAVSAGYRTMVKEGKVEGNSDYLFNLQSTSSHQAILILPSVAQNATPKIVMQHKAKDGQYDYHVRSDWSDVREIGGHSVVKITFAPKIEGFTTPFVAQISHDGYFMIIRNF